MAECKFYSWDPQKVFLTCDEAQDIVQLLFRGDSHFFLYGVMSADVKDKSRTRGNHQFLGSCHVIHLNGDAIVRDVKNGDPVGGTIYVPDPRLGAAMVLAHEVQHANQHLDHANEDKAFWGTKKSRYENRAAERDARMFADQNMKILASVLDVPLEKEQDVFMKVGAALRPLWDVLTQSDETISAEDLRKEMQILGIGDDRSFEAGLKMFRTSGILEDDSIVNLVQKVV
jgi:hypothetical protein